VTDGAENSIPKVCSCNKISYKVRVPLVTETANRVCLGLLFAFRHLCVKPFWLLQAIARTFLADFQIPVYNEEFVQFF
jgi:hypothetical protein